MNNTDDVTIRKAEAADAVILTDICKRAFDSDVEVGNDSPGGPPGYDSVRNISGLINNKFLDYYTVLYKDAITGGFIAGSRGPGYRVCEQIYIDPDKMRMGIGQRVFELIWGKYPDADLWTVGTPVWNTRTNQFYPKIGFNMIGTTYENNKCTGNIYQKRITKKVPGAMVKLKDVESGQYGIVVGGILKTMDTPRTVKSRKTGKDIKVANALLADDEASVKLILWDDQIGKVKGNTKIRIDAAYVKEYKGERQLMVGRWGAIIILI